MADSPLSAFSVYKKQNIKLKPTNSKKKSRIRINSIKKAKKTLENGNAVSLNAHKLISKKKMNGHDKASKGKLKQDRRTIEKHNKLLKKHAGKATKCSVDIEQTSPLIVGKQRLVKISKSDVMTSPRSASTISSISSPNGSEFHQQPQQVFEWMIAPVKPSTFFKSHWEKGPLFIKRYQENYYQQIFSTEKLDSILRENSLFFTRNVDVVSYVNGVRETHNPDGRAIPAALWDYYENGCSIRILNPQTYCHKLHALLATLQEYFGCMAGINAYLTPPGSQGFAPHYDDIEAFVLQLEGRKHWKLYSPLTIEETLPRFSSKNFDRKDLKEPLQEVTLEAGDILYFPRGVIHEGRTDADAHSLHITVSVYQRTAYVDLMEHILKPALAAAAQDNLEFREGLPLQYLQHVGMANADNSSQLRSKIMTTVGKLFGKMMQYISVDAAADEMAKQFMWDAMPPVPSKQEKLCMVHEDGDRMFNGKTYNKGEVHLELKVRLLRYHCLHITSDSSSSSSSKENADGTVRIYYCTENAKYYHGEEQQFLEIDEALAPAVKCLLHSYPAFVEVKSLPLEDDMNKMQIVSDLWERGLIVTETPLESSCD